MAASRCVLVFDTALFGCSAGVYEAETGKITAQSKPMPRGQAEALVPMIGSVLEESGKTYADIDLIGVTAGPGAFTGIRIGLATARALGLALDKPVIGVSTFDGLALHYHLDSEPLKDESLLVLLDTKRKDYYAAFYGPDCKMLDEPLACAPDIIFERLERRPATIIGDGIRRFRHESGFDSRNCKLTEGYDLPGMQAIAQLTVQQHDGAADGRKKAEPVYLRGADVSQSKKIYRKVK